MVVARYYDLERWVGLVLSFVDVDKKVASSIGAAPFGSRQWLASATCHWNRTFSTRKKVAVISISRPIKPREKAELRRSTCSLPGVMSCASSPTNCQAPVLHWWSRIPCGLTTI